MSEHKILVSTVIKRSGTITEFDKEKIVAAIYKAMRACSLYDRVLASDLATRVVDKLVHAGYSETTIPSVENIQDMVELVLLENRQSDIAKAYILYRQDRRLIRG